MVGLSKALIKKIASLDDAKGRRRTGWFIAEGSKCVCDLARRFSPSLLVAQEQWLEEFGKLNAEEVVVATPAMIAQVSRLHTLSPVFAVFNLPEPEPMPKADCIKNQTVLVLDRIQDPGNFGTIVRTCDWLGIRQIVASNDSVDCFNPKAVQASMGALAGVAVSYGNLPEWLATLPKNTEIYGTFLGGENAFKSKLNKNSVIIMGNEGQGISSEVERFVSRRITIPAAPGAVSESLNVATATAIILALIKQ